MGAIMPNKINSLKKISTNVRYMLTSIFNKKKDQTSQKTCPHHQKTEFKNNSPMNEKQKNRQLKSESVFPQEDELRTDFLTRLVEKVNLDIFDDLF